MKHKEIWKDIRGYSGKYQVSNKGRIRSLLCNRVKILSLHDDSFGYLKVTLHAVKRKHYRVHRLVAQAFIPNPKRRPQINHKDGNKRNNGVKNLKWVTNRQNYDHALKNNLVARGERSGNHKLTIKQVLKIRLLSKVLTAYQIKKLFDVAYSTIHFIIKRKSWRHI
jgi:hypothetical protein